MLEWSSESGDVVFVVKHLAAAGFPDGREWPRQVHPEGVPLEQCILEGVRFSPPVGVPPFASAPAPAGLGSWAVVEKVLGVFNKVTLLAMMRDPIPTCFEGIRTEVE